MISQGLKYCYLSKGFLSPSSQLSITSEKNCLLAKAFTLRSTHVRIQCSAAFVSWCQFLNQFFDDLIINFLNTRGHVWIVLNYHWYCQHCGHYPFTNELIITGECKGLNSSLKQTNYFWQFTKTVINNWAVKKSILIHLMTILNNAF